MYYPSRAKELALTNNQDYHLVAWAKKGSSVVFGINSDRCSARFSRIHPDGSVGFHLHAEMDLIRKFQPGDLDQIKVIRFSKSGEVTMSKPCPYCQRFLRRHGVKRVKYTTWDGEWKTLEL